MQILVELDWNLANISSLFFVMIRWSFITLERNIFTSHNEIIAAMPCQLSVSVKRWVVGRSSIRRTQMATCLYGEYSQVQTSVCLAEGGSYFFVFDLECMLAFILIDPLYLLDWFHVRTAGVWVSNEPFHVMAYMTPKCKLSMVTANCTNK